ncbi:MAG: leucyl aminopeptidase [Myxococcota bacterium]|nr:leucyl aminopeptidase [Myxococcota bacterium]
MQIQTSALADAPLLAVVLTEGDLTVPAALDEAFGGALSQLVESEKFKAKAGSSLTVRGMGAVSNAWVGLFGAGEGDAEGLRKAAGAASNFARSKSLTGLSLQVPGGDAKAAEAIGEAIVTGNYRYERYLPEARQTKPLEAVSVTGLGDTTGLDAGVALGTARSLARDLINEPPADIYPETLAAAATKLSTDRLQVEVWGPDRLESWGAVGTLAVGRGSSRTPRLVHMTYTPAGESQGTIALIGKGVTFDAGGLSIKPSAGMVTMKCDMGGAAAVVGVMSALEKLGVNVTVHGIFAAAENMLGADAYKLGDVLRYRNGKTVEIHNTDAEGRLLLADCLCYASEMDEVTHIVDLATLTGAAVVALGEKYTALYANEQDFADTLLASAKESGEGLWQMPLENDYNALLKADIADIKNVGGRAAGSITAALYLQNFVAEGKTWAHLDIAGPAFLSKPTEHLDKGGAGPQVVTLLNWLRSL